jgi:hypothetical protein
MLEKFLATEQQGMRQRVGRIWFQGNDAIIHTSYSQSLGQRLELISKEFTR